MRSSEPPRTQPRHDRSMPQARLRQYVLDSLELLGFALEFESHGIISAKTPDALYRHFDCKPLYRLCFDKETAFLDHDLELVVPGSRFLQLLREALARHNCIAHVVATPENTALIRKDLKHEFETRCTFFNGSLHAARLIRRFRRLARYSALVTHSIAATEQQLVPVMVDLDTGELADMAELKATRQYDLEEYQRIHQDAAPLRRVSPEELARHIDQVTAHVWGRLRNDLLAEWTRTASAIADQLAESEAFFRQQLQESAYPREVQGAHQARLQALQEQLKTHVDLEIVGVVAIHREIPEVEARFSNDKGDEATLHLALDSSLADLSLRYCATCDEVREAYFVSYRDSVLLCQEHGALCRSCGDATRRDDLGCEGATHPSTEPGDCSACRIACALCDRALCQLCKHTTTCCEVNSCDSCTLSCSFAGCQQSRLCREHALQCRECGHRFCRDHAAIADCCGAAVCAACAARCPVDDQLLCTEHRVACLGCETAYCREAHPDLNCTLCNGLVCASCIDLAARCQLDQHRLCPEHAARCAECDAALCVTHRELACRVCSSYRCVEHITHCPSCGSPCCDEHRGTSNLGAVEICPACSVQCAACENTVAREQVTKTTCCGVTLCSACALACTVCAETSSAGGSPGCLEETTAAAPILCPDHVIRCTACQATLCNRHEDLTCWACGLPFCPDHLRPCASCGTVVCAEHRSRSAAGDTEICAACTTVCQGCGMPVYQGEVNQTVCCAACLCSRCAATCAVCGWPICKTRHARPCKECHAVVCADRHANHACVTCGQVLCTTHFGACPFCGRGTCSEHRIMVGRDSLPGCFECVIACGSCGRQTWKSETAPTSCCGVRLCPFCVRKCAQCGTALCPQDALESDFSARPVCSSCVQRCLHCRNRLLPRECERCSSCSGPLGPCCPEQRCSSCRQRLCDACSLRCALCASMGRAEEYCAQCAYGPGDPRQVRLGVCAHPDCGTYFCSRHGKRFRLRNSTEEQWLCDLHIARDAYDDTLHPAHLVFPCRCCGLTARHATTDSPQCRSCVAVEPLAGDPELQALYRTLIRPRLSWLARMGQVRTSSKSEKRRLVAFHILPAWSGQSQVVVVDRIRREVVKWKS